MKKRALALFFSLSTLLLVTNNSSALSPFKKAFDEKYVKPSDGDEFKAAFKKLSCNTCHVKGKKKDWLNAYGLELSRHVVGRAKQRLDEAKAEGTDEYAAENDELLKELQAAFAKTDAKKSPSGVTFGELFKSLELPTDKGGGTLK